MGLAVRLSLDRNRCFFGNLIFPIFRVFEIFYGGFVGGEDMMNVVVSFLVYFGSIFAKIVSNLVQPKNSKIGFFNEIKSQ